MPASDIGKAADRRLGGGIDLGLELALVVKLVDSLAHGFAPGGDCTGNLGGVGGVVLGVLGRVLDERHGVLDIDRLSLEIAVGMIVELDRELLAFRPAL